uniref:Uncharacterized protein n=1 Tax=Megaselia scalaris TaxID=36166 RepID=T1GM38_MEGSC
MVFVNQMSLQDIRLEGPIRLCINILKSVRKTHYERENFLSVHKGCLQRYSQIGESRSLVCEHPPCILSSSVQS